MTEPGRRVPARLPLIVLEGPPGIADREGARLRASGHDTVAGFGPAPAGRGPTIRIGVVASPRDAADALLVALDGAGLVVEATGDRATVDRLIEDLRRLGPVDHRVGSEAEVAAIEGAAREILGLLAEGYSLGEAAAVLGLARRTADRRLAAARRALGTERTTEAIGRARRLGWLGPGRRPGDRA